MCGGGGGDEGAGKGAGGDDFYTARIVAAIKNGGRRRPTATVRPRPRNRSIEAYNNQLIYYATGISC